MTNSILFNKKKFGIVDFLGAKALLIRLAIVILA